MRSTKTPHSSFCSGALGSDLEIKHIQPLENAQLKKGVESDMNLRWPLSDDGGPNPD